MHLKPAHSARTSPWHHMYVKTSRDKCIYATLYMS